MGLGFQLDTSAARNVLHSRQTFQHLNKINSQSLEDAKLLPDRVNFGISLAKIPPTPAIRRLLVVPFRKYTKSYIVHVIPNSIKGNDEWTPHPTLALAWPRLIFCSASHFQSVHLWLEPSIKKYFKLCGGSRSETELRRFAAFHFCFQLPSPFVTPYYLVLPWHVFFHV